MMRFWLAGVVAAVSIALVFEGALCRERSGEPCSTFYTDGYYTPRFIYAAEHYDLECMKEFHAAGDNINRGTKFETVAIEALCYDTRLEGLKLMISWGAKFYRALDVSVCRAQVQCVQVLVEAGAVFGRMPPTEPCTCAEGGCDDATYRRIEGLLGGGGGSGGGNSCGLLDNTDFPSSWGVLNDGRKDRTNSNGDCCAKCASNPSCAVWTRIDVSGECWLRKYAPKAKARDGATSGVNSCSTVSQNTDFPSKDGILNDGKKDITKDNAACCKKCNADYNCQAWTRVKYDTYDSRIGECWLRSYVPNGVYEGSTDSGQKASVSWLLNSVPDEVHEGSPDGPSAASLIL
ncbi:hypothetical protein BSKO_01129 [Bryopsis sp. KO-2023]|nr:hypothetical protein BSKO_01129 [Bryopsis sp. KO-2023]